MWPFKKGNKKTAGDKGDFRARAEEILAAAHALFLAPRGKAGMLGAAPSPAKRVERAAKGRERALAAEAEKRTEELEKEVQELYTEPDGTIPDLSRLDAVKSHRLRNLLIGLTFFFALLAAAAWTGFFVFTPYARFDAKDLTLAVEAPESVKSGEQATIVVRYAAPAAVPLGKLELSLKLPKGFTLAQAEPAATEGQRWVIGTVPAGGKGEIRLTGTVFGVSGALLTVQAFATYVPGNFNAEFQSVSSAAFTIAGSTLALTATSTERALPGEPVFVTFAYVNEGPTPLAGVAFRAGVPQGFVAASSTPSPSEGAAFWRLGDLAPGAKGTVTLRGTFSSEAKGELPFTGELGLSSPEGFTLQTAATTPVSVIGGDLVLTTIVNGGTEGAAADFGDRLNVTVAFANKSEATLDDVTLVLNLAGVPTKDGKTVFDPASIADAAKGTFATTTIRWTKKEVPKLEKLSPGDEGSFDVSFRLAAAPFAPGVKDYALDLWVEGQVGKVNGVAKDRKVQSAKFHFPFLSDTKLVAQARYYNDDEIPVGTGPLPPKVGTETTYRIFWTLTNALHELGNLSLRTTLPENVRFTGKTDVSAGTLAYDETAREVRWTLNRLPAGAPTTAIDFEVALVPGTAALGNILPLTGTASFDAEDAAAGAHVLRTADAVDTSLEGDPLGRGKGVVTQ